MRVLFTNAGSAGHFGPLIPFARAVLDAGGDVLVATKASMAGMVEAAGFEVWPLAEASPADRGPIFGQAFQLDHDAANELVAREVFGRLDTAATLPGVLEACATWRPDVVVHEPAELAAVLVAEHLGIPRARVGIVLGATEEQFRYFTAQGVAELRAELGLAPDPDGEAIAAAPYLTLTPSALEDPAAPGPADALRFREEVPAANELPDWWPGNDAPLLYVTFGSVAAAMGFYPAVYRAAVDALAGLDVRILLTTGHAADPAELGALPSNVHVERWVPQADVMPQASAMVVHGGFGTVRAALCAGLPLAVAPLFADQPYNARRVAAMGAGIAIEGGPGALAGLGHAVRTILDDPSYAAAASAVAADAATLPPVTEAVSALQALAAAPA
jgi:UDP:flavonoid glycosyltransferase YjiC (YdhE family)